MQSGTLNDCVSNLIINASDMLISQTALKDLLNQHSFSMHNKVFQIISEHNKTITAKDIQCFYQSIGENIQSKDAMLFIETHSNSQQLSVSEFVKFIASDDDSLLNCNTTMLMDTSKVKYYTQKLITNDIEISHYIQNEMESLCNRDCITTSQLFKCISNENNIDIDMAAKLIKEYGRKYISKYKIIITIERINSLKNINTLSCYTPLPAQKSDNHISGEKPESQQEQHNICKKINYDESSQKSKNSIYQSALDVETKVNSILNTEHPDIKSIQHYKSMLMDQINEIESIITPVDNRDDSLSLSENDMQTDYNSIQQNYDYIEEIRQHTDATSKVLPHEISLMSDHIIDALIVDAVGECMAQHKC